MIVAMVHLCVKMPQFINKGYIREKEHDIYSRIYLYILYNLGEQ